MKPLRVKTRMEAPRVLDMMVAWKANISLMWFCTEQRNSAEEPYDMLLSAVSSTKLLSVANLLPACSCSLTLLPPAKKGARACKSPSLMKERQMRPFINNQHQAGSASSISTYATSITPNHPHTFRPFWIVLNEGVFCKRCRPVWIILNERVLSKGCQRRPGRRVYLECSPQVGRRMRLWHSGFRPHCHGVHHLDRLKGVLSMGGLTWAGQRIRVSGIGGLPRN
jgi:hypothetical protein